MVVYCIGLVLLVLGLSMYLGNSIYEHIMDKKLGLEGGLYSYASKYSGLCYIGGFIIAFIGAILFGMGHAINEP